MTGRGSIPLEDPPVCLERFREDGDYKKQHGVRSWGQAKFEDRLSSRVTHGIRPSHFTLKRIAFTGLA